MINRIFCAFCFTSAAAILTTPAFSAEAMRCNAQTKPGVYQPVLRIQSQGARRDIIMGEDGLTRKIFYRDRAVIAYISQEMNIPITQLPSSVSSVCGSVEEVAGSSIATAVAATAPTTTPETGSTPSKPDAGNSDGGQDAGAQVR